MKQKKCDQGELSGSHIGLVLTHEQIKGTYLTSSSIVHTQREMLEAANVRPKEHKNNSHFCISSSVQKENK